MIYSRFGLCFAAIVCFLAALAGGCHQDSPSTTVSLVSQAKDSTLRNEINQRIDSLHARIREAETLPVKFLFPGHGPTDSIAYWLVDGKPARAQLIIFEEEAINWPTYYMDTSGLLLVRLRYEFRNDTIHYAHETMNYLRDGKVAYGEERKIILQPGEAPGLIRVKPFLLSQIPLADMQAASLKYYDAVMMAVNQHMLVGSKPE